MLPRPSNDDVVDVLPVKAILLAEFGRPIFEGNIFCANLTNECISEFGLRTPYTLACPLSSHHICDIFLLGSFDQMPRIDAESDIASVTGARIGPSPELKEECKTMSEDWSATVSASSIDSLSTSDDSLFKRPDNAIIARNDDRLLNPLPLLLSEHEENCMTPCDTLQDIDFEIVGQDHPPHPSEPTPPPAPAPEPEPEPEDEQGDATK